MKKQLVATALVALTSMWIPAFAQDTGSAPSPEVNVNVEAPQQSAPAPAPPQTTNIEVDAPSAPAAVPAPSTQSETHVTRESHTVVETPDGETNWALIIGVGVVGLVLLGVLVGASSRSRATV